MPKHEDRDVVHGWCAEFDGKLDLRTCGPTKRSAMVNWLHLYCTPIYAHFTDQQIEDLWRVHKRASVEVVVVKIIPVREPENANI